MGFAIIPIIYTIAEDALAAVPDHLRSASLASGATPWQTAWRIVIPTAMSGLFSAVMIGMGRAIGETMIVVMASGNTPVMNWNIFSETWNVIAMVRQRPDVFQAILGVSWFWLLGVVFVTQIPLFTLDSLKGGETIATIIFALFSVFIGVGDGTFGAKTDYPSAATPFGISIGDLNRDGKLDISAGEFWYAGPEFKEAKPVRKLTPSACICATRRSMWFFSILKSGMP